VKKPTPIIHPEHADQIRKARVGVVIQKIKSGKSVTAVDQAVLDEAIGTKKSPKRAAAYASSMAQAAAMMGVPKSTLKAAKAQGAPGFIGSRVYMEEVRFWLDAEAKKKPQAQTDGAAPVQRDLRQEIADLNAMLCQVDENAKQSLATGAITLALELLQQRKALSDQRNAAMVQARRQGKTEDDSISRQEVERLARALAHNAALGLQRAANKLVDKLDGITDPRLQHPIIVDALATEAYIAPFEQALNLAASHGLPDWLVSAIRTGVDLQVEDAP